MAGTHSKITRKALLAIGLAILIAVPVCAQFGKSGLPDTLGLRSNKPAAGNGAEWSAALERSGKTDEVTLRLSVKLAPEHYVYSTAHANGALMKLNIKEATGVEQIDDAFLANRDAERVNDLDLNEIVEKYHDQVTWSRKYRIKPGADAAAIAVAGEVVYQICDAQTCRPGQKFAFAAKLAQADASVLPTDASVAAKREKAVDASTRFEQFDGNGANRTVVGTWLVQVEPKQVVPGGNVTVTVQAELAPHWHIYALDQQSLPDGSGPSPTGIGLTESSGLIPVDRSFRGPAPIERVSDAYDGLMERSHEGKISWTRRFKVPEGAAGELPLRGKVAWQTCYLRKCLLVTGFEFQGELTVGDREISGTLPLTVTAKLRGPEAGEVVDEFRLPLTSAADTDDIPPPTRDQGQTAAVGAAASRAAPKPAFEVGYNDEKRTGGYDKSQGLPGFLVLAVLAGFGALVTPCVFPMIPITVSFFQKQAEKEHHRPITMALVYCLGIIATFTGLGMLMSVIFGAGALNQLSNNVFLNLFIAGVLVFFALNLLGMFEIRMPSWLLTFSAGKESKGGFVGVLFMALTFTLTSFTCTFAFAGLLLAEAMKGDRLWPILGLLAFSAAFSLPFFFLALFPSFLQKLPKSGGWMNIAKVVMGLIELGFAFKYLGAADQTFNGQAAIIDFHMMLAAWIILSIAIGLYLLGFYRLPHDTAADHIGVFRFISALSFLGLASYLAVGMYSAEKPHGLVWKYAESFANPKFEGGSDPSGPYLKHGELKYALDFERALKFAIAENKPIFLDFTGVNCSNCRLMEKGPMSQPKIKEQLARFVRIQLFTDSVPINDRAEAERLRDFNVKLQERWYGNVALPSYAVIPSDQSVLSDPGKILSELTGLNSEDEFASFLDRGWAKWQKVQASRGGRAVSIR